MKTESRRALLLGGITATLLVAALIIGFVVLRGPNRGSNSNSSPSPQPTDPHAQVEQAYLRFWAVWAEANEKLDGSRLEEVATGEALDALKQAVQTQRANNQPVRIRVEHNYQITITDETTASVDDRYINHSQRLDPNTKEPIEPDPNVQVRKSHTLKKVDGLWKVTEIIEYR